MGGLVCSSTSNVPNGRVTFSPLRSAVAIDSKTTFTAFAALGRLSSYGSHFDLSLPVLLGEIAFTRSRRVNRASFNKPQLFE